MIGGGSRRRCWRCGIAGSGSDDSCRSRWCRGLSFQQVLLTRALGLVSASSSGFSSSLRVGAGVVPRMGAGVPSTVGPLSPGLSTGSGTSVNDQPRRISDGICRPLSVRGVTWTKPATSSSCNRRRAVSYWQPSRPAIVRIEGQHKRRAFAYEPSNTASRNAPSLISASMSAGGIRT